MLYDAYEFQRAWLASASAFAAASAEWLGNPSNPIGYLGGGPVLAAALDVFSHAAAPRGKPDRAPLAHPTPDRRLGNRARKGRICR